MADCGVGFSPDELALMVLGRYWPFSLYTRKAVPAMATFP